MKLYHKISLPIVVLTSLLMNCQKEKLDNILKSEPGKQIVPSVESEPNITVEQDYLYFKSLTDFNKTIGQLNFLAEEEKNFFEQHFIGFKSLRKTYVDLAISDSIFFAKLEDSGYPASNPDHIKHCPDIINNLSLYDKHFIRDNPEDYLLLHRITNQYASVCNARGLFRIGDTLIYCSHDTLRVMTPINFMPIEQLKQVTQQTEQVKIQKRLGDGKKLDNCRPPDFFKVHPWPYSLDHKLQGENFFSTNGNLCLYMEIDFMNDPNGDCASYYTGNFSGQIVCCKRNWIGCWVNDPCHVSLELSYNTSITSSNMPFQGVVFNGQCQGNLDFGSNKGFSQLTFPSIYAWDYFTGLNITHFHAKTIRSGSLSDGEVDLYHE